MTRVVLLGGAVAWLARRLGAASPAAVGGLTAAVLVHPLGAVAAGAVVIARARWRAAASEAEKRRIAEREVTPFCDLVALALTAGLSLRAAFAVGREHVAGPLAAEVDGLVDEMDTVGVSTALGSSTGILADMCRVVAGAAASGAPVAAAVSAHAATRRHAEHAARLTIARKLPVRLLLPLALLILPGFVVLAVGPALLQALARLGPGP